MPSSKWMQEWQELEPIELKAAILRKCEDYPGGAKGMYDLMMETIKPLIVDADDISEFRFMQVADFLANEPPPPPPLAVGFMPANKLSIWGAKPKMGKSLLALYVLSCVAKGDSIFGRYEVAQGGAVYIGMEDGWNEIATRLRALGLIDRELPIYINCDRINYADPANLLFLEERLNSLPVKPALVWIDTARQGIRCKNWDDPAEVTEAFQGLRELAQRTCHIAVNHHNRKADAEDTVDLISGSNALTGAVDAIYALTNRKRLENGDIELLLTFEGRGLIGGKITVRMDTNTMLWRLITTEEEEEARRGEQQERLGARIEEVKQAIQMLKETATLSRIEEFTGFSHGMISNILREMKNLGIIAQGAQWKGDNDRQKKPTYILSDPNSDGERDVFECDDEEEFEE